MDLGLAGSRMSPFWILLELRTMEVVVVTTGTIRRAKFQSNCRHPQTSTQLFTGRMSFLSPNQQCQSTGSTKAGSANDEGFSFCLTSLVVWKLHQVRPGAIKGLQRRTFGDCQGWISLQAGCRSCHPARSVRPLRC